MSGGIAAEVKSRLNIVDVIGESVQLKKAGTTYKGLCPFHGEKTPSFTVTPARDSWKCFGCGLGGDVFSFVMQRDSVPFPEALRTLANKAGVEIDERTKREDAHRARLRDILETGIAFYHQVLTATKLGAPALDYLRGRGFTDATIETAQLGWAPDGWETMSRRLVEKRGIRADELVEVGLASPGRSATRGVGVIDRFRGRVLFPIRDQNGAAVGIGGRILGAEGVDAQGRPRDTGPKYLNSPATPLFDKSRTLYLIDKAKGSMRKSSQAVIVEGYTDALMAHQAGFDNVVASLGTALTPGQVALLTRYAKKIALAYDVDAAGQKAGTFGVQALEGLIGQLAATESGVELDEVRVVRLPDGKDPDEVLRESPDLWREEVRTAQPIVDYLIDTYAKAYDLKTPGGKARFVDALMPTIRAVPNPVMRDGWLQRVRQVSGVEERILLEVLRGGRSATGLGPRPGRGLTSVLDADGRIGGGPDADKRIAGDGGSRGGGGEGRISAGAVLAQEDALRVGDILRGVLPQEQEMLRLMLLVPEIQAKITDAIGPDRLPNTVARELFRALVVARQPDDQGIHPPFSLTALVQALDPETAALAQALVARRDPNPRALSAPELAYEVERLVIDLEERGLDERSEFTQNALAEAEQAGDLEAVGRLIHESQAINDQRRSLHRRRDQTRLLSNPNRR
ncbi:MAG TPA: DNA primase [Candidatus Sulfomarinibacteraceae bacterium]|nr:DNA primase [Candidatus Sulfomarinibacteraceae bacterium]